MSGAQNSRIYGTLLGDAEIADMLGDEAQIRAMLDVEGALARVQGRLGIIPEDAARVIDAAAANLIIAPDELTDPTFDAGVPVIALVARLRDAAGTAGADYVHWGATSQDIMDTALVLNLRGVLSDLENRLGSVMRHLVALARLHRDTLMPARTRSQHAVPTTFGAKAAGWLAPLLRHRQRLDEMRPRLLVVQLGGAAGTLAPFGPRGSELAEALAAELKLNLALMPWHAQRDCLVECANWLSGTASILGKAAQDLILMAQTEVGEVRFAGGGSSTMPQKSNPVLAEAMVALAGHANGLAGTMNAAMLHAHERDASAWSLEWLTLPQLAEAAGAALQHAGGVLASLEVDTDRMAANLEMAGGTIMAEAASFALSEHMPRAEAKELVRRGCEACAADGGRLTDWLRAHCDAQVDWQSLDDPAGWLGAADKFVDDVCAEAESRFQSA